MPTLCRQDMVEKDTACLICGDIKQVWRKANKNKNSGHPKPLYCERCMTRTYHIELPTHFDSRDYQFGLNFTKSFQVSICKLISKGLTRIIKDRGERACSLIIRNQNNYYIAIIDDCYPENPFIFEASISSIPISRDIAKKLISMGIIKRKVEIAFGHKIEDDHHTIKIIRDRVTVLTDNQSIQVRSYVAQTA